MALSALLFYPLMVRSRESGVSNHEADNAHPNPVLDTRTTWT
jgi:hypothetical protein